MDQSPARPVNGYLCTDNAVMGAIAIERLRAGLVDDLDLDAYPGVVRKPSL